MPMYDYSCDCGEQFELITRYDEQGTCPYCHQKAHRKLSAPAGVNGGFYDRSVRVNRQKQTHNSAVR